MNDLQNKALFDSNGRKIYFIDEDVEGQSLLEETLFLFNPGSKTEKICIKSGFDESSGSYFLRIIPITSSQDLNDEFLELIYDSKNGIKECFNNGGIDSYVVFNGSRYERRCGNIELEVLVADNKGIEELIVENIKSGDKAVFQSGKNLYETNSLSEKINHTLFLGKIKYDFMDLRLMDK
jgi:hypothetical protein